MANEVFYNGAKADLAQAVYDWATVADARIRILLLSATDATAANPDTDTVTAALAGSATEEAGTGYTRKDMPASGRSVTEDDTNNRAQLEAGNITWTGADWGTSVAWLIYYDSTGTDADGTNWPIAYGEESIVTNGGDMTLSFPNGVARHS